ncbi:hypothetical protein E4V99_14010 [Microbacterium sp. dk485]|uniref:hypothetical protein n=1 Tax=Microbacterium sp. dk485 TaxID=2560021 RepID=UPI001073DE73|nr:hypothetical protein [Microbacterium sp. dk485]TFV82044.1 hypothetical protein E4V99_14010 [Microbacterium sp. dk485]
MSVTITAQDGTGDSFSPAVVTGYARPSESGNVVHELIDGSIAVTLVGDRPAAGTVGMAFGSDIDAEAAREMLRRPTTFALLDEERPALNMTFIRYGQLGVAIHDAVRHVWTFDVGYQEILT